MQPFPSGLISRESARCCLKASARKGSGFKGGDHPKSLAPPNETSSRTRFRVFLMRRVQQKATVALEVCGIRMRQCQNRGPLCWQSLGLQRSKWASFTTVDTSSLPVSPCSKRTPAKKPGPQLSIKQASAKRFRKGSGVGARQRALARGAHSAKRKVAFAQSNKDRLHEVTLLLFGSQLWGRP